MKKLINKILKKEDQPASSSRITSETVAHHRERVLAGGRKFKYPIQYARHKLVINAILISVAALILITVVGWWQLYIVQNTNEFMYRVTKVIPVPIATVDGQSVSFSDYLMKFRSSSRYLEQKEQVDFDTPDGEKQIEYIKQQSINDAIADAYAFKLAKQLNISVSSSELEGFLKEQRQSSDGEISEQTYNAVIMDYYGWDPEEYRHVTENKLLRQKVAYEIDQDAINASNIADTALKNNPSSDFKTLADQLITQTGVQATSGTSGLVPKTNQDGGLASEASKMTKGQVSGILKSTLGDGYYFIRLTDINDTQVNYEFIKIPLTKFSQDLDTILNSDKVNKFIKI